MKWMSGLMNEWMNWWIMYGWRNEWTVEWINERKKEWRKKQMTEWASKWMSGRMGKWMNVWLMHQDNRILFYYISDPFLAPISSHFLFRMTFGCNLISTCVGTVSAQCQNWQGYGMFLRCQCQTLMLLKLWYGRSLLPLSNEKMSMLISNWLFLLFFFIVITKILTKETKFDGPFKIGVAPRMYGFLRWQHVTYHQTVWNLSPTTNCTNFFTLLDAWYDTKST